MSHTPQPNHLTSAMHTTWRTTLRATLAATALGLCAVPSAQAWNTTPTSVSFANGQGLMLSGLLYTPAGAAPAGGRPAVVMLHGCSGIYYTNVQGQVSLSSQFSEWGDRLAAAGYTALLVDSFTPRSAGSQCNNGAGTGVSEIFDRPQDAVAARNYLASTAVLNINASRIGVVGWSHGASTVMATLATTKPVQYTTSSPMATGSPFRVGVAFYPGAGLADSQCTQYKPDGVTVLTTSCWNGLSTSVWDSYAPLAFFHGAADTTTSPSYLATRASRAQSTLTGASMALTMYAGAQHSFDEPGVGGGSCTSVASTPNACAKSAADAAAMQWLAQWLN